MLGIALVCGIRCRLIRPGSCFRPGLLRLCPRGFRLSAGRLLACGGEADNHKTTYPDQQEKPKADQQREGKYLPAPAGALQVANRALEVIAFLFVHRDLALRLKNAAYHPMIAFQYTSLAIEKESN